MTLQNGTRVGWRHALFDTRSLAVQHYDIARNEGAGYAPALEGARLSGIANYHFPVYEKVFFVFPEKFWDNSQFYNIFSPNGLAGSLWQNLDLGGWLPGSRILYYTITSPESQRFELLEDEQIANVLLEDLRRLFGAENVPEPEEVTVSRWINNPYFRGTYSNRPPNLNDDLFYAIFEPFGADNSVVFTGEAYCARMNGYLHAAILAAQTSYDEWKIRQGEAPFLRATPRDNVCFTDAPVSGPEGDSQKRQFAGAAGKHRLERMNHGQKGRRSDNEHRKEVEKRVQKARSAFTGYTKQ